MGATVRQRARQAADLVRKAQACLADVPTDDKRVEGALERASALVAAAVLAIRELEGGMPRTADRLELVHRMVASALRGLRELEWADEDELRRIHYRAASNGLDGALIPWLDLAVAETASDRAEAEARMLALLMDEGLQWPEAMRRATQIARAVFGEAPAPGSPAATEG